ncbi:MAG: hypothetical protein Q4G30_04010 [Actinomycetaceae bacterium]|nr:hypothetical protein [Actinomycetaceae bacterium]
MTDYLVHPLPEDLEGLCRAYSKATGSHAMRLASLMLRKYRHATLSDVSPENAQSFLRLRATVLDTLGDLAACRAIYHFTATMANAEGDVLGNAGALAQLHVDRSFRLDGDSEHGSPSMWEIRKVLIDIAGLVKIGEEHDAALATQTLLHLVHGLALIGATNDALEIVKQAESIAPKDSSLDALTALAKAEILSCTGHIDQALEQAEFILGIDSPDPLGLQIQVRQFLGTWYRAIGNHSAAATHLRVATQLCFQYGMEAKGVTCALELVSSLLPLGEEEELVDIAATALDVATELDINSEVVHALNVALIRTLYALERYSLAIQTATIAGDRACSYADPRSAVEIYDLGAQGAIALSDYSLAAGLYATCSALSTGESSKARFLRLEARMLLSAEGIYEQPNTQDGNQEQDEGARQINALRAADALLDEALTLLISTPVEDKAQAAVELAHWNHDTAWIRLRLSEAVRHLSTGHDEEGDPHSDVSPR